MAGSDGYARSNTSTRSHASQPPPPLPMPRYSQGMPMGTGSRGTGPMGTGGVPNFLAVFGAAEQSLYEIANKAQDLQQRIDDNAEQEKASLRAATEQKHQEIERHANELARHAANSIESYKATQLQTAERQKDYHVAVAKQQAEHAKKIIEQQAAQAIAAVEARDRQMDLQRQQRELMNRVVPPALVGSPPTRVPGAFPVIPPVPPVAGAP